MAFALSKDCFTYSKVLERLGAEESGMENWSMEKQGICSRPRLEPSSAHRTKSWNRIRHYKPKIRDQEEAKNHYVCITSPNAQAFRRRLPGAIIVFRNAKTKEELKWI